MYKIINGMRFDTEQAKFVTDFGHAKIYKRKVDPKYFMYYADGEQTGEFVILNDDEAAQLASKVMTKAEWEIVFTEQKEVQLLIMVPKMVKETAKALKKQNKKWTLSQIFMLGLDRALVEETKNDVKDE